MLKLYNSLTKRVEVFRPICPNKMGFYVCGVTVYDRCHLGHGRIFVVFDLLHRLFKTLGYQVNYVRNVTDIDDKIIQKANQLALPIHEIADRYYQDMLEDEKALNILPPTHTPKVSEHLSEIINFIQLLIQQGYAYSTQGEVYFAIKNFKAYGELAHQTLGNLLAGVRVQLEENKNHPLDFVLWKSSKTNEPGWDSPWGRGRPGWHIECSAMAQKYLGSHFDLHGGGIDLLFPHHQNELAQSQAANGVSLANYWMHVGFVQLKQEKMSKSQGNFLTIQELLKDFSGETLRYFYLTSQYQNPINFSYPNMVMAENSLRHLYLALKGSNQIISNQILQQHPTYQNFMATLLDNLNTPGAIAILFDLAREINQLKSKKMDATLPQNLLKISGEQLGLFSYTPDFFLKSGIDQDWVEKIITKRSEARQQKDWIRADQLRNELMSHGVILEDQNLQKTEWYLLNKKL